MAHCATDGNAVRNVIMPPEISRRNLFRLKPGDYFQLFKEIVKPPIKQDEQERVRPPGALSNEEEFLSVCERCHECSLACPYQVIEHLGPIAGNSEGTPFLVPEENPCHWCTNMDCIRACPSGALAFGPNDHVPPIGTVTLNLEECLNEHGILCDTCVMHCPSSIQALTMVDRRPKLDADACVGCGLCVFYCDASPGAFSHQPLH